MVSNKCSQFCFKAFQSWSLLLLVNTDLLFTGIAEEITIILGFKNHFRHCSIS